MKNRGGVIAVVLFMGAAIYAVASHGCGEESPPPEPEPAQGYEAGHFLQLCGCHQRDLPKNTHRQNSQCESLKSVVRYCEKCADGAMNCEFWCPYPLWEEVCS